MDNKQQENINNIKNSSKKNVSKKEQGAKKSREAASWFLFWLVPDEEIQEQVNNYDSYGVFKSARGWSMLLLILSSTVSLAFILFTDTNAAGLIDAILFLILGIFIYKGQRWALIVTMILWTLEKFYVVITVQRIGAIIWWGFYMRIFYLAYKVESVRAKSRKQEKEAPQEADI